MKPSFPGRITSVLVLSLVILSLASARAYAFSICLPFVGCFGFPSPAPQTVPEIDAGMAVSGVTLLIASTMVLVDRFRRR
jgi:hypothetical protein